MKHIFFLCTCFFLVNSALAVFDPGDNLLGLYLDQNADVICGPAAQTPLYVILTNPTYPEINGVEFGVDVIGGPLYVLSMEWPEEAVAIGSFADQRGDWACGFAPLPTTATTLVCSMLILPLGPATIIIGANAIPSASPDQPCILVSGAVTEVGLPTYCNYVSYGRFGCCEVPTRKTSFDHLKSLYR